MRNFIPIIRCVPLVLALNLYAAQASGEQNVDFQIGNWSLEQIVVAGHAPITPSTSSVTLTNAISNSAILQAGIENEASFYTRGGTGGATVSYQLGQQNMTQGVILDSPGSSIAQFQLGEANQSDVVIAGGSDNAVATVQIGNRLEVSVGLINSQGTTVVYGQAGNDYNGSIVFQNAPAGTVITLN